MSILLYRAKPVTGKKERKNLYLEIKKRRNWTNEAAYPLILKSIKTFSPLFFHVLAEDLTGNKNLCIILKT